MDRSSASRKRASIQAAYRISAPRSQSLSVSQTEGPRPAGERGPAGTSTTCRASSSRPSARMIVYVPAAPSRTSALHQKGGPPPAPKRSRLDFPGRADDADLRLSEGAFARGQNAQDPARDRGLGRCQEDDDRLGSRLPRSGTVRSGRRSPPEQDQEHRHRMAAAKAVSGRPRAPEAGPGGNLGLPGRFHDRVIVPPR